MFWTIYSQLNSLRQSGNLHLPMLEIVNSITLVSLGKKKKRLVLTFDQLCQKSFETRTCVKDDLKACWTPRASLGVHNEIVLFCGWLRIGCKSGTFISKAINMEAQSPWSWSLKPGFCFFLSLFTNGHAECLSGTKHCIIIEKRCKGSW